MPVEVGGAGAIGALLLPGPDVEAKRKLLSPDRLQAVNIRTTLNEIMTRVRVAVLVFIDFLASIVPFLINAKHEASAPRSIVSAPTAGFTYGAKPKEWKQLQPTLLHKFPQLKCVCDF